MSAPVDRSKFLGGSDAAAVLGISPWRTPLDLYLDKIEPAVEDVNMDRHRRSALNRGKRLEPYVLDMLRDEHGVHIVQRNARYIDEEHCFLACEVDAEATADGDFPDFPLEKRVNIEVKTVSPFKVKEWGELDTDQIPVHYTAQAMHGLMVTGRDRCIFAVLIGDDLRLYRVDRDVETIEAMRAKEVAFWNQHVLAKVPPPATTASDMLRLFAKDSGKLIEATPEIVAKIEELRDLKKAAKRIDEIEEQIKVYMADAATLAYEGSAIATWKTQIANRFAQREFEAAHPQLFQQFKRASESRVLRIK